MNESHLDRRYEQAARTLESVGQAHVLKFYDSLDAAGRWRLLEQIESQDWKRLAALAESHVRHAPPAHTAQSIEPAPFYPAEPTVELAAQYSEARMLGEKLISGGHVAAFTVAGGQGTRLGWDGPKGTYPATPITNKPLFQVFAEQIIKTQQKYAATIPWYIMTSPANDADTRRFFAEHDHFRLDAKNVTFFPQGTIPSFSFDGRVLLAAHDELALNPDGHGGSLRALHTSGAIDDMVRRGVKHISYFQVDNPLVRCVDPLFIGLHAHDKAQMSSKMVLKTGPKEKVGVLCNVDGRIAVIEYSDLPDELAEQTNPDGTLRFIAGSIAIHIIDVDFVRKLNDGDFGLPFHRAVKKVPHVNLQTGRLIEPTEPNAVKLETFVFDAVPLAERSIVLQTLREQEFAPIKNASGVDSAESSRQLQSQRAATWLEAAGATVPRGPDGSVDALLEISPLTAVEADDLTPDAVGSLRIERGARLAI